MIRIENSILINSPPDRVWQIIKELDNEPLYWHGTRSIKNIEKSGNTIKREVTIAFNNSKCKEIVHIDPRKVITVKFIDGPFKGSRKLTVQGENENQTSRLNVEWKIKLSGFLSLYNTIVKKHISEGTEQALLRISRAGTDN